MNAIEKLIQQLRDAADTLEAAEGVLDPETEPGIQLSVYSVKTPIQLANWLTVLKNPIAQCSDDGSYRWVNAQLHGISVALFYSGFYLAPLTREEVREVVIEKGTVDFTKFVRETLTPENVEA